MAAIFGVVIAGSFIEMGVSQILPWVKKLITRPAPNLAELRDDQWR